MYIKKFMIERAIVMWGMYVLKESEIRSFSSFVPENSVTADQLVSDR